MAGWLLLFAASEALACGGPTDTRLVGWSRDGTLALVRFEAQSEEGVLHDLKLELLDLAGKGRGRTWTILEPRDDGDAKVRGARWQAAEPEIAAAGVVIEPEVAPLAVVGPAGNRGWQIPGKDYQLVVESYSFDEATARRWELRAKRGEREVVVSVLLEASNSGMPFGVGRIYLNPQGTHLVLTDDGTPIQDAIPIAVADVEKALGG